MDRIVLAMELVIGLGKAFLIPPLLIWNAVLKWRVNRAQGENAKLRFAFQIFISFVIFSIGLVIINDAFTKILA
ncbi:hypothetical protein [Maritalea myrionectae]|uniref:hypothetical protein n=1 Tax=Maritalea myrionectae TaxID=454601 RepID=UPI0013C2D524|nr:hypothetical protein [Maritalea myrionectae]